MSSAIVWAAEVVASTTCPARALSTRVACCSAPAAVNVRPVAFITVFPPRTVLIANGERSTLTLYALAGAALRSTAAIAASRILIATAPAVTGSS